MRLALVTGNSLHHKFWVSKLSSDFDVKLIFHPQGENIIEIIKRKNVLRHGLFGLFLKLLSICYNFISSRSISRMNKSYEHSFFKKYEINYDQIPSNIISNPKSINSEDVIQKIKNEEIDVICFLGGDIAKKDLINSPKLFTLNFHSGVSPLYNGTKTTFHPCSDNSPNFCGGTLMRMTEKIDGGRVLLHYFPSIKEKDTASSIFMKTIIGSTKLYNLFLKIIKKNHFPEGVIQSPTKNYSRYIDWTIINDLRINNFHNRKIVNNFLRKEKIISFLQSSDFSKTYKYLNITQ